MTMKHSTPSRIQYFTALLHAGATIVSGTLMLSIILGLAGLGFGQTETQRAGAVAIGASFGIFSFFLFYAIGASIKVLASQPSESSQIT